MSTRSRPFPFPTGLLIAPCTALLAAVAILVVQDTTYGGPSAVVQADSTQLAQRLLQVVRDEWYVDDPKEALWGSPVTFAAGAVGAAAAGRAPGPLADEEEPPPHPPWTTEPGQQWTTCTMNTICPNNPTVCEWTQCPQTQTFCPVLPTVCEYTTCPQPTLCPIGAGNTTCPGALTVCPVKSTVCEATNCPSNFTFCPYRSTVCPVQITHCPASKTSCPGDQTKCPAYQTVCPEKETECPVSSTSCPKSETSCPPKQTECPLSQTQCPHQDTQCPVVPTVCPAVACG